MRYSLIAGLLSFVTAFGLACGQTQSTAIPTLEPTATSTTAPFPVLGSFQP